MLSLTVTYKNQPMMQITQMRMDIMSHPDTEGGREISCKAWLMKLHP